MASKPATMLSVFSPLMRPPTAMFVDEVLTVAEEMVLMQTAWERRSLRGAYHPGQAFRRLRRDRGSPTLRNGATKSAEASEPLQRDERILRKGRWAQGDDP